MFRLHTLCLALMVLLGAAFPDDMVCAQGSDEPALLATGRTSKGRYVNSIAFAPDGKTLAAGTTDGTIYFWQTATGKEIGTVPGNNRSAIRQGIAFSPNGKIVAACAPDGALCLWEAPGGKKLFRLGTGTQQGVPSVVFSPNGKLVAATDPGYQGRGRVWEVETGKELALLHDGPSIIYHLAFTPDSKMLVGTGYTKKKFENVAGVHLWDAATGKHLREVFGATGGYSLTSFALSPDGKTVAVGFSGHTLELWDVAGGKRLFEFERHSNQVHGVAFSPDGKLLASGCEDGKLRLFEVSTGRTLAVFASKQQYVWGIAISHDGKRLASCGMEPTQSSQLADAVGSGNVWDLTSLIKGAGEQAVTLTAKELQDFYGDLQGAQDQRAFRAIFTLTHAPEQAMTLLKGQLKPAVVSPAQAKRLAQWIADLGHDQKAMRDQATAELERLGQAAEPALRKALAAKPSAEARKRLEWLLGELRGLDPTPDMRLARRAAELLERIGTPQARQLLGELASGAPEAWLTQEASLALQRLAKNTK
jgi:WD40 repeat protein